MTRPVSGHLVEAAPDLVKEGSGDYTPRVASDRDETHARVRREKRLGQLDDKLTWVEKAGILRTSLPWAASRDRRDSRLEHVEMVRLLNNAPI